MRLISAVIWGLILAPAVSVGSPFSPALRRVAPVSLQRVAPASLRYGDAAPAAARAPGAAPAGVYALVNSGGTWLARILPNGTVARVGPGGANASWAPSQGLAVLDPSAAALLTILGNEKDHNAPSLFTFDLATGDVTAVVPLPFVNGDTIGVEQFVSLAPDPGEAIVGGTVVTGDQVIGAVDRHSGAFREIARLNGSDTQIAISCSRGTIAAGADGAPAVLFGGLDPKPPYARLLLRVTLSGAGAGRVTRVINPDSHQIYSFSTDPLTGDVVGLGSRGQEEEEIVARLSPRNMTTSLVGAMPSLTVNLDGLAAIDTAGNALAWVGAVDADSPFLLVRNSLEPGAAELSRVQVCVSLEQCNLWSLDIYSPPAV